MLQAIYSVNRSHHNSVVKCEATNDIGTNQAQMTLDVHCESFILAEVFQLIYEFCAQFNYSILFLWLHLDPPSFIETPKSIEAELGDKVTLKCSADGNPLEIVWIHDDRVRITKFKSNIFNQINFITFY